MDASEFALSALAFVLTYAIHSTLLLGLACVLAPRIVRSLALREKLWKTAMFGGLVTALVQVGASMETPLFHWTLSQPVSTDSLAASAPLDEPPAVSRTGARGVEVERDSDRVAEPEFVSPQEAHTVSAQSARVRASTPAPVEGSHTASPVRSAPPEELESAALERIELPEVALEPSRAAQLAATSRAAPHAAPHAAKATIEASASWLTAAARRWRTWTVHGLALWAAFTLAVLAVFAWMCVRLVRCMRGRTELGSGPLRDALDRLLVQAGPRGRRIRLYVAPELRAPVSLGWLRPAICVPPRALVELSADEQESMLAHELAHLLRRDPLWLSAAWLVERVFFFQPLHRVARAELHDLAELACDEWAAQRTGDRLALASCLARIAEWIIAAPRALPATSMAEHHGRCRLTQRIERLLDDESGPTREERARRWLAPSVASGLGLLVFVAPGVSAPSTPPRATAEQLGDLDTTASAPLDRSTEPWSSSSAPAEFPRATAPAESGALELAVTTGSASWHAAASSPAAASSASSAPDERAALSAELAHLHESLSVLRAELAPLCADARELEGESDLARTLAAIARRVDNLERRSQTLREMIQVLETLESMPAHPSSTSVGFQGSRSLP